MKETCENCLWKNVRNVLGLNGDKLTIVECIKKHTAVGINDTCEEHEK